jgi:hypothetical protein
MHNLQGDVGGVFTISEVVPKSSEGIEACDDSVEPGVMGRCRCTAACYICSSAFVLRQVIGC